MARESDRTDVVSPELPALVEYGAILAVVRPRLIVICGLPGSGKTTLATKLKAELGVASELALFEHPLD